MEEVFLQLKYTVRSVIVNVAKRSAAIWIASFLAMTENLKPYMTHRTSDLGQKT